MFLRNDSSDDFDLELGQTVVVNGNTVGQVHFAEQMKEFIGHEYAIVGRCYSNSGLPCYQLSGVTYPDSSSTEYFIWLRDWIDPINDVIEKVDTQILASML